MSPVKLSHSPLFVPPAVNSALRNLPGTADEGDMAVFDIGKVIVLKLVNEGGVGGFVILLGKVVAAEGNGGSTGGGGGGGGGGGSPMTSSRKPN